MSIMDTGRTRNHVSSSRDWAAFNILAGGMLGMVVAMGIGRFAFTPILPLMQRDLGMSHSVAGWLAGLNYLGYLAGAIACTIAPKLLRSQVVGAGALALSLATTIFMGVTLSPFWWGIMRLVGGVASSILFIIISAEVGESLARRGYGHWFGALYGGIGLGIALSGLIVPHLDKAGGWSAAWTGIGGLAVFCAIAGMALGRTRDYSPSIVAENPDHTGRLVSILLLAMAYFLEGLGYIVTATFIVAIIATTPGLETFAPSSWVAVGLAAVPSTILWPYLARRIGNKRALLAAYAIQIAGILVSRHATSVFEVIFAAVTFGGTFLGIVALTMAEGNLRMGKEGRRAAAFLTASFSVGQMLGPVIAGMLADRQDGFAMPLLLAAASVTLGCLFIALDRRYQLHKP
ncbi:MAG TPA: YbfB/YjiJ family MFS transporter [Desulfuromonadales bacterium]|nr:YbfB/YjiJ family MFS transporter [Desulfuromonadales bacterium]